MPRDAGADQKDQRTDRSCAACERMARTRRGKIRKKDTPASRADRPSSPNLPATTDRENHSEALVASTFSTKSATSRHCNLHRPTSQPDRVGFLLVIAPSGST